MGVRRTDAVINQQLDLRLYFRYDDTGELFDPSAISKVEILDTDGTTVLETITAITKISIGYYKVVTSATWNTKERLIYDKWYFTPAAGGESQQGMSSTSIRDTAVPSANMLITVQEYKDYYQIESTSSDDLIKSVILGISATIERKTNKKYLQEIITDEYFSGDAKGLYRPNKYPVLSVSKLEENQTDWTTLEAESYVVYKEKIELSKEYTYSRAFLGQATFTKGQKNWRITYTVGMASVPYDIKHACKLWCGDVLGGSAITVETGSLKSVKIGDFSKSYFENKAFEDTALANIPPEVAAILSTQRRVFAL